MPISIVCSKCQAKLGAPDAAAGKTVKCPKCQASLVVPAAAPASEFEVVDDEPAPKKAAPAPARPAVKKDVVVDDDEDDDRPKAKRRPREDDEDDEPRRKRRPRDDDDSEDDADDRPRKKKGKGKKAQAGMSPAVIGAIAAGVLVLVGGGFAVYWFGIRDKPNETVKKDGVDSPANSGGPRPRRANSEFANDPLKLTSNNNLKQMVLAFHNGGDIHQFSMIQGIYDSSGKVGLSWRVALLPYIERKDLYDQFHLNEPWDSPHNKALISRMPRTYAKPGTDPSSGMTHYRTITGPGTIFPPPPPGQPGQPALGLKLTAISDGTSNTALVVEAADPVEWTRPDDLVYTPGGPLPKLGFSPDGYMIAIADGSVRWFKGGATEKTLRALCTATAADLPGSDY